MTGKKKTSCVKNVPEKCDEWLSTRNKRKLSPIQQPFKKHRASVTPFRVNNQENHEFLLTQNSPPPPELKTFKKQSSITSFFQKSSTEGQENLPPCAELFTNESLEADNSYTLDDGYNEENYDTFNENHGKNNQTCEVRQAPRSTNITDSHKKTLRQNQSCSSEETENCFKMKYVNANCDVGKVCSCRKKGCCCQPIEKSSDTSPCKEMDTPNIAKPQVLYDKGNQDRHNTDIRLNDIQLKLPQSRTNCERLCNTHSLELDDVLDQKPEISCDQQLMINCISSQNTIIIKGKDLSRQSLNCDNSTHLDLGCEDSQEEYTNDFLTSETSATSSRLTSSEEEHTCDILTTESSASSRLISSEEEHTCDILTTESSASSRLISSEEADRELDNFSLSLNTQYYS